MSDTPTRSADASASPDSEQQAGPVAQIDWGLIAKAAGEHGVRYRTNTALLAFLDEIEPARKADRFDPALPCKSGEGAGEETISDRQINAAIRHGFGDRFADDVDDPCGIRKSITDDQFESLFVALHRIKCNPSMDEIALVMPEVVAILQPDVLRDRITVLERENSNYAKTMDIIGQLPAALTPDATQTREAEGDTVKFVQDWLMNADYDPTQFDKDFAAAIDARVNAAIEAAAKVADAETGQYPHGNMMYGPSVGPKVAAAIRLLSQGAGK